MYDKTEQNKQEKINERNMEKTTGERGQAGGHNAALGQGVTDQRGPQERAPCPRRDALSGFCSFLFQKWEKKTAQEIAPCP